MADDIKKQFEQKRPLYKKLGGNICEALKTLLEDRKISVLSVEFRCKSYDSFSDKINRKSYKDPLNDIEDICGLRIIAYFPNDVLEIDKIIQSEFNVLESEVKAEQLEDDQFGYRSDHFVVTVKGEWLATPNYRELGGLKAEIQVRTVLMHAWADLSHKLAYKKKDTTPSQFLRQINQLSALFELADDRFEHLRRQKDENISDMVIAAKMDEDEAFSIDQPLNVDTLQAYLDYRFPEREKATSAEELSDLISEMNECDISLAKFDVYFKKCEPVLVEMEKMAIPPIKDYPYWSHPGMIRMILAYTDVIYKKFIRDKENRDTQNFTKIKKLISDSQK